MFGFWLAHITLLLLAADIEQQRVAVLSRHTSSPSPRPSRDLAVGLLQIGVVGVLGILGVAVQLLFFGVDVLQAVARSSSRQRGRRALQLLLQRIDLLRRACRSEPSSACTSSECPARPSGLRSWRRQPARRQSARSLPEWPVAERGGVLAAERSCAERGPEPGLQPSGPSQLWSSVPRRGRRQEQELRFMRCVVLLREVVQKCVPDCSAIRRRAASQDLAAKT